MRACHSQPANHVATIPDPAKLLAQPSRHMDEGVYQAWRRRLTQPSRGGSEDREGAHDPAHCSAVIGINPAIDPAATELKDSTSVHRPTAEQVPFADAREVASVGSSRILVRLRYVASEA